MGVRLVKNTQVVHLAANAGFDALFIDLEHSTLSIEDSSQHCIVALQRGITPFVRVPHQCGNGYVQKVLDGGAMGVIFPHIHGRGEICWPQTNVEIEIAMLTDENRGRTSGCVDLQVPSPGGSIHHRTAAALLSQGDGAGISNI